MIVILPGPGRWPGHSQVCQMYDHSYRTTRPARSREWSRPRETGPPLVRSVLAGHYGCSPARTGGSVAGQGARRGTAPRALDRGSPLPLWAQLRADLQRRLAAGAFTKAFPRELALVSEYGGSRQTVRDRPAGGAGLRQASIVRARDLCADGVIADRLGLEASTPLFHLERLRLAGGEPLALDTVWPPAEIAAPLLEANTALYDELAART